LVDTKAITYSQGKRSFVRFMLDQDTGGAIKAPGRADIFMGIGKSAEILAGGQYAEGTLCYIFLKPEYVTEYLQRNGTLVNAGG
ncbi:MAG: 3D domain-containing protein, partial [Planctomycetota bacterium]